MRRLYFWVTVTTLLCVVVVVTSWGASGDMVRYVSEPRFNAYSSTVNARFNALGGAVPGTVDWAGVANKPAAYAPAAHTQSISTVTGLQTVLDAKSDTTSLSPVATSGAYADLTGTPTLVNPDWVSTGGLSQILNKPVLGTSSTRDVTTVVSTTGASDTKVPTEKAVRDAISGSVAGVSAVTSATADIVVATGTSTPVLTLNSGTGANQIVKLDASAKLPAVDGSLLLNVTQPDVSVYALKARTVNGHQLSSDVVVTKADLGLGTVENTAVSAWQGGTNLITLGTVTTGTWHGAQLSDDYIASATAWNSKQSSYSILTTLGVLPNSTGWLRNNGAGVLSYSSPNKDDVGLSSVDNTSDSNKPISAAAQTALDLKQTMRMVDTVTGIAYKLTIDNGVLNLEEIL